MQNGRKLNCTKTGSLWSKPQSCQVTMDFSKPAMLMPDDVVTPREPLWAPFTHCVQQLTNDWDVMQNAVSTGFGADDAEFARFKVVEYTLANFADLWNKKKDVDPAEVSNFLQLTMDDFFHVDIANSAYPLAKVLVRIFSECLQGVTTGIDAVLARIKPQSQAQAQAPQARAAQRKSDPDHRSDDESHVMLTRIYRSCGATAGASVFGWRERKGGSEGCK